MGTECSSSTAPRWLWILCDKVLPRRKTLRRLSKSCLIAVAVLISQKRSFWAETIAVRSLSSSASRREGDVFEHLHLLIIQWGVRNFRIFLLHSALYRVRIAVKAIDGLK